MSAQHADFRSATIRVDGVATHYLEGGAPGADNLVLIHDGAFGGDGWTTWRSIMPRLAERFHVFAPDLLGFGGTQKIYDFGRGARSQKIDHVAGWMKAMDIRETHVVGNSIGGSLVLFAAMRGDWPILKAASIAGTGGPFMRPDTYGPLRDYLPDRQRMRSIVELLVSRRDALMEELVEERYQKSLIRGHWENLSAPRLRPPGPRPAAGEEGSGDKAFLENLAKIQVPVLLIAGGDDRLLEIGWEKQLAARMNHAATLVVEGARHQPQFDAPDLVGQAIEAFLRA